jgi:hypothetical protein
VLAAGLKSLQEELKSYVHGGSAAAAVLEGDGGWGVGGEAGAGMPQVHAVLLEQLDLVPSKGGIEAAGLRFMQLQVRGGAGKNIGMCLDNGRLGALVTRHTLAFLLRVFTHSLAAVVVAGGGDGGGGGAAAAVVVAVAASRCLVSPDMFVGGNPLLYKRTNTCAGVLTRSVMRPRVTMMLLWSPFSAMTAAAATAAMRALMVPACQVTWRSLTQC